MSDITLTQINPGEDADADVLMGNFNTLKNILSSTNTRLDTVSDTANSALSGSFSKSGGTLTGNLVINKSKPYIYLKNSAQTAGTPPQSSAIERIYFKDSENTTLGQVANVYSSSGSRYSQLTSAKGDGTGNAYLSVGFDASGKVYTYAPTPENGAHENTIATTGWVRSSLVPNYGAGVTVSYSKVTGSSGYTAPSNGVFMARVYPASSRDPVFKVNGTTISAGFGGASADADVETIVIMLAKNDVLKLTGVPNSAPRDWSATFYPYK